MPENPQPDRKDRGANGRFSTGNRANPGGLTKERRAFLNEQHGAFLGDVPLARRRLRHFAKSEDGRVAVPAAKALLERALGAVPKPSEMPSDVPEVPEAEASLSESTARLTRLVARAVANLQSRVDAGDMGPDTVANLATLLDAVGDARKREREAQEAGGAERLPTGALLAQILAKIPPSEVRAALQEADKLRAAGGAA